MKKHYFNFSITYEDSELNVCYYRKHVLNVWTNQGTGKEEVASFPLINLCKIYKTN